MKNILFIILALFLLSSCKKGGEGGNTTVVAMVTHHGKAINGARVYVKYGSYNFAGKDTAVYNSTQLTNSDGYSKFSNLKFGYYSFYAVGYDSTEKTIVTGEHVIKVKRKDNGNEVELGIGVTEE